MCTLRKNLPEDPSATMQGCTTLSLLRNRSRRKTREKKKNKKKKKKKSKEKANNMNIDIRT